MSKLRCHSSTKKEEIYSFITENMGEKIELHYECNMSDTWGDDDVHIYDTGLDDEHTELLQMVETHYIHNIETK